MDTNNPIAEPEGCGCVIAFVIGSALLLGAGIFLAGYLMGVV